jgi:hypothetical protein
LRAILTGSHETSDPGTVSRVANGLPAAEVSDWGIAPELLQHNVDLSFSSELASSRV